MHGVGRPAGRPPHTFSAVLGAVRAAGGGFEDACAVVRPGFDASAGRAARAEAGAPQDTYTEADLYADVRPALAALRADGLMVGVADNLTAHGADMLRGLLAEEIELVAASEEWGAAKPDPAFFRRLAGSLPFAPGEILYVGDRWPYDIRPAAGPGCAPRWCGAVRGRCSTGSPRRPVRCPTSGSAACWSSPA